MVAENLTVFIGLHNKHYYIPEETNLPRKVVGGAKITQHPNWRGSTEIFISKINYQSVSLC